MGVKVLLVDQAGRHARRGAGDAGVEPVVEWAGRDVEGVEAAQRRCGDGNHAVGAEFRRACHVGARKGRHQEPLAALVGGDSEHDGAGHAGGSEPAQPLGFAHQLREGVPLLELCEERRAAVGFEP